MDISYCLISSLQVPPLVAHLLNIMFVRVNLSLSYSLSIAFHAVFMFLLSLLFLQNIIEFNPMLISNVWMFKLPRWHSNLIPFTILQLSQQATDYTVVNTKRYCPLSGPCSSSCKGLWPPCNAHFFNFLTAIFCIYFGIQFIEGWA